MNDKVDEKHMTDADREAERIAARKKANEELEQKRMADEAKAGIARTQPGVGSQEPQPLAKDNETD